MKNRPNSPTEEADDLYRGFPLRRVTWGYREQFRRLLDSLYRKGLLNRTTRRPADVCGPLLAEQPEAGYDYVLKEFLSALDGPAGWLLRVPTLFEHWRDLGAGLAEDRVYLGKRYFQLWSEDRLPAAPEETRMLLGWAARLKETDAELALSFLAGYPRVRSRLTPEEMPDFIENGVEVFRRNPESGLSFFQLELKSAAAVAERLGRCCRLDRMKDRMGRLFRAVAGRSVNVDTISKLDSDDLLEYGSTVVCGCDHLYLPERVSTFSTKSLNRSYYLLTAILAGVCYGHGGFCSRHGEEGAENIHEVCRRAGAPAPGLCGFLLQLAEVRRLLTLTRRRYPGAAGMLREVTAAEVDARPAEGPAEQTLKWAAGDLPRDRLPEDLRALAEWLEGIAADADDHREVLCAMRECWDGLPEWLRSDGRGFRARPLSFFPDFSFPLRPGAAPADSVVLDMGAGGEESAPDADALSPAARQETAQEGEGEGPEEEEEEEEGPGVRAAYLYDEWNGLENDYYRDWCSLQEVRPEPRGEPHPPDEEFRRSVARVKRLFQRLQPDLVTREKYLQSGDYIDIDSLVRFITLRKANASPRVRFWVKPRLNRRDVATALLMDVSGSTGRESDRGDVIEVEKEAAGMLAAGLGELGDEFGIYGFTGNGRENCLFYRFKDFGEDWDDEAESRLRGARPGSSTRIGVALRHAGRKLAQQPARTRLIVLLTDGRPMDTEYDPQTRYAHHDVRKACEENGSLGIHTFCIAVDIEEQEELDIMFPRRRYVVLEDAGDLPQALTRSYLKLTRT